MKATLFLKKEHETLRQMLDGMRKPSRGNDKAAHLEQIRTEMALHWRIERELFYPELENTTSTQAAALVGAAAHQQDEIEKLFTDLLQHFSAKKFDTEISELYDKVDEYLRFEEEQVFEEARQYLSEFRMEQLGLEMEDRRRFLTISAA
jgi:hypothetical protein